MCERYGITNCRSLDDMMEIALAFDDAGCPKGTHRFVTTSGARSTCFYDLRGAEARDAGLRGANHQDLMPFSRKHRPQKTRSTSAFRWASKHAAGVCESSQGPNVDMIAWAHAAEQAAPGKRRSLQNLLKNTDNDHRLRA